jgi:hypothetical protein
MGGSSSSFTAREGGKERMIVGMLNVNVGDPNRHGRRDVKFTCLPGSRSGGGFYLTVTEEQWPAVEPFVREVEAAL